MAPLVSRTEAEESGSCDDVVASWPHHSFAEMVQQSFWPPVCQYHVYQNYFYPSSLDFPAEGRRLWYIHQSVVYLRAYPGSECEGAPEGYPYTAPAFCGLEPPTVSQIRLPQERTLTLPGFGPKCDGLLDITCAGPTLERVLLRRKESEREPRYQIPGGVAGGVRGRFGRGDLVPWAFSGWTLTEREGEHDFLLFDVSFPVIAEAEVAIGFSFSHPGDGDFLSISFRDEVLWEGAGTEFPADELTYALLPSSALSGLDGPLLFSLTPVGDPSSSVAIDFPKTAVEIPAEGFPGPATLARVAGTGVAGFSGDGGPADLAQLDGPAGLATDAAGNLYIADRGNHRIRRVDALTGDISTVAGTGAAGYNGDGIPADTAQLNLPTGLVVEPAGHLLFADSGNHRVRRITSPGGLIETVAGTGTGAYDGDGVLATAAALFEPSDVALATNGDLFVADRSNHRLRRIRASDWIIETAAGNGAWMPTADGDGPSVALRLPTGLALDGSTGLLISEAGAQRIRRLDLETGALETVSGDLAEGGTSNHVPAADARWRDPAGLAVDPAGSIWVTDAGNHAVRRIEGGDGPTTRVAGTLVPGFADDPTAPEAGRLFAPRDLVLDGPASLWVAESGSHVVRRLDLQLANLVLTAVENAPARGLGPAAVQLTVQNLGPQPSHFTQVAMDLEPGLRMTGLSASQGGCSSPGPSGRCHLGILEPGASADVLVGMELWSENPARLHALAVSSRADLAAANNETAVVFHGGLFVDGFESGDLAAWN